MKKILRKKVNNKPYFYLTERAVFAGKSKKIQVYLGKSVPKDLRAHYDTLHNKELDFVLGVLRENYKATSKITLKEYENVERARLEWKYATHQSSERAQQRLRTHFAIKFIFESNSIEGSRLKASEVEAIVRNKYVKKSLDRREVQEVENSIQAYETVLSGGFVLNQRSIINLHKLITNKLSIQQGYKKHKIIVNNKETTAPGEVRKEMTKLLKWYKEQNSKKTAHNFELAIIFHQKFEHIHPFEDGNGRTGRMLLNWMLHNYKYGPILIKNSKRNAYFSALDKADEGREVKLVRFAMKTYRDTIAELLPKLK